MKSLESICFVSGRKLRLCFPPPCGNLPWNKYLILCSIQDAYMDNEEVGGYTEMSDLFLVPESFQAIDNLRHTTLIYSFLKQDACWERRLKETSHEKGNGIWWISIKWLNLFSVMSIVKSEIGFLLGKMLVYNTSRWNKTVKWKT